MKTRDLVIIGGGAGGLVVASVVAQRVPGMTHRPPFQAGADSQE